MKSWPPFNIKVLKTPLKDYAVVLTSDFDDEDDWAITDHKLGRIKINNQACLEYQWQGFFHEKIHVAEFIVGMKPLKDHKEDSDAERLGMGLCMIDAANGWIPQ